MNPSPSFRVKLAAGVLLRDPYSGRVVTTGESVPRDTFWTRRLADGDVSELEEETAPDAGAAPTTDEPLETL